MRINGRLIAASIVVVFFMSGIIFLISHSNANDLCSEIYKAEEKGREKLNYKCDTDSDCIHKNEVGPCGSCINKNTSQELIDKVGEIYAKAYKSKCHPEIECIQRECFCINHKCITQIKK